MSTQRAQFRWRLRTDEKSASATGSWTATNTVKKYLEGARLPTQETQLSVSKGSSHIHSSKHGYSWASDETSLSVPSQQRQQENLRQSVPSHPTWPLTVVSFWEIHTRVGLRVSVFRRRLDGKLWHTSTLPPTRRSSPLLKTPTGLRCRRNRPCCAWPACYPQSRSCLIWSHTGGRPFGGLKEKEARRSSVRSHHGRN